MGSAHECVRAIAPRSAVGSSHTIALNKTAGADGRPNGVAMGIGGKPKGQAKGAIPKSPGRLGNLEYQPKGPFLNHPDDWAIWSISPRSFNPASRR
jgi:hypothetical protein